MSGVRGAARPGLVAGGHPATVDAAAGVLRDGGNAVDAAVAGGLAAAVAEPCLTSPGGGGFLLVRTAAGDEVLVDAFVAAPGRGGPGSHSGALVRVPVDFGHAVQDFHVGPGSVAVPGLLAGYLHAHERFGRLDLDRVVAPAVHLARRGVTVDRFGAQLVGLLTPILCRTAVGRSLFLVGDRPLAQGDTFRNEALAQFLADLGAGRRGGLTAAELGGGVTRDDLAAYRVEEREPSRFCHRGAEVVTNPPPSFGATLVAHGLALLGDGPPLGPPGDPDRAVRLAGALVAMAEHRTATALRSTRGTTHLSVADGEGGVVAMTTSNGSGSGEFAGDTGVQLNNVMGEEDLHPAGLGTAVPGTRVGSMMAPTFVEGGHGPDRWTVALGSGGSERIRSTITQLVVRLVDDGASPADAVAAPRLHWDGTTLQAEPGLPGAELAALAARWPLNVWSRRDLYFGGAHAVALPATAVGDPRRGGVGTVVWR